MSTRRAGVVVVAGCALLVTASAAVGEAHVRQGFSRDVSAGLIAYGSYQPRGADIYVMNADGTGKRRVGGPGFEPAWSPDGTRIAFASTEVGEDIFVMNADGSDRRQLTHHKSIIDQEPAWSPDGQRIAFVSGRDWSNRDGYSIYVMNGDGRSVRRLTRYSNDHEPAWPPDGKRIAFQRNLDIYVMNADGSGVKRLTRAETIERMPAWSPDGRRIAFERNTVDTVDINGGYLDDSEIYVMNADGSGMRRLLRHGPPPLGQSQPAWSPDGRRIAFRGYGYSGSIGFPCTWIQVVNIDGSGLRNLTRCTGYDAVAPYGSAFDPAWQPVGGGP